MKIHNITKVTDKPFLNLFEAIITGAGMGDSHVWIFASRKDDVPLEPDTIDSRPDAVVIVPTYVDSNGIYNLVVIKEFRVPLRDYEYGFPAGLIDGDESIEECVRRELLEETGLTLTKIDRVSPPIYSAAGMTDESTVIAFVECTGELSTKHQEGLEQIEPMVLTLEQVTELYHSKKKFGAKAWLIIDAMVTINAMSFGSERD